MNAGWRLHAHASASSFVPLLLASFLAGVLLNALIIAGATNCASAAPDFRCATAKFIVE